MDRLNLLGRPTNKGRRARRWAERRLSPRRFGLGRRRAMPGRRRPDRDRLELIEVGRGRRMAPRRRGARRAPGAKPAGIRAWSFPRCTARSERTAPCRACSKLPRCPLNQLRGPCLLAVMHGQGAVQGAACARQREPQVDFRLVRAGAWQGRPRAPVIIEPGRPGLPVFVKPARPGLVYRHGQGVARGRAGERPG